MLKTRHYPASEGSAESAGLVVLVHGAMDRLQSFGRVARRLTEFNCLAFDRRGYAGSLDMGAAVDPQQHVDDILTVADDTGVPPERTVLVGHSVGGLFALMAADQFPDRFRAVGAYEPPTPWVTWWPRPASDPAADAPTGEVVEWFYRQMVGDHAWDRLSEKIRKELTLEGPALSGDLLTGRDQPMFDPMGIGCPVVIGVGEDTMSRHLRAAHELAEQIPTASLHTIEGAGHGAHRTNADAFAEFARRAALARG